MRHECSNCKYYWTDAMTGDGRALGPLGSCGCDKVKHNTTEADDWCNNYERAAWFEREEANNEIPN